MKLHFPFEFLEKEKAIERVNELLPLDIRLLAVTKVTKAFNSHTNCSNRRYCYLLPTYTLLDVIEMNTLLHGAYINQGPIIDCARMGGFAEPGSTKYLGFDSLKSVRKNLADYRVTSEKLELFRRALDFFVGTKSYHNFTTGKESEDDSAKRYITECICSDPFNSNSFPSLSNKLPLVSNYDECDSNDNKNIEWVCITVSGQSFLLNQIRKMVGFAVDASLLFSILISPL
jgi:tRNA pseudouridine38-40 synthase